jgi:hypothetical protein
VEVNGQRVRREVRGNAAPRANPVRFILEQLSSPAFKSASTTAVAAIPGSDLIEIPVKDTR